MQKFKANLCHSRSVYKYHLGLLRLYAEAVNRRCSVKKASKKFQNNSQKNNCAGISFSILLEAALLQFYLKKHWHSSFYLKFAKFLKRPILKNVVEKLLLLISPPNSCTHYLPPPPISNKM